jgi:hypothetical protein
MLGWRLAFEHCIARLLLQRSVYFRGCAVGEGELADAPGALRPTGTISYLMWNLSWITSELRLRRNVSSRHENFWTGQTTGVLLFPLRIVTRNSARCVIEGQG